MKHKTLENFKNIMDDAFKDASFYVRLKKEEEILTEARKHLTRKEFQELEDYVLEKLKKLSDDTRASTLPQSN